LVHQEPGNPTRGGPNIQRIVVGKGKLNPTAGSDISKRHEAPVTLHQSIGHHDAAALDPLANNGRRIDHAAPGGTPPFKLVRSAVVPGKQTGDDIRFTDPLLFPSKVMELEPQRS
jgi:hypothetical protein